MRKFLSVIAILFLLFGLSACSGTGDRASEPLSIGILPDVDSIPVVIAKEKGYFEKEGLKANIESFKSAVDRDSALQTGKIDGAVSDILAAVFAMDGGFDVKITSLTNGSYKLLVGKDSGISSFSDIKGKSVAVSKNTIIEYATDKMLEENNISPDEIKKTVIAQIPVRLEMLQNGKIDAATLPEPLASVAVKDGARILNSTDKLGINPGVLLFTKKALESKQDEIKAFYRAYNEAVEYLQKENISSYIDILIKEAGFPEAVRDTLSLPSYTKASLPSAKDFDNVMGWLNDKGLVKKPYKFDNLVDGKFVR